MNRSEQVATLSPDQAWKSMSGVDTSLPVRQGIDRWMLTAVMALVISLALENRLQQLKGKT